MIKEIREVDANPAIQGVKSVKSSEISRSSGFWTLPFTAAADRPTAGFGSCFLVRSFSLAQSFRRLALFAR